MSDPSAPSRAATVVITSLAEYQTEFWFAVARELQAQGVDVHVCAFDDFSAELLRRHGIAVSRISGREAAASGDDQRAFFERMAASGMPISDLLFSHERVTFRLRDTAEMRRRFVHYAIQVERVLDDLRRRGRQPVMLQELGGFLSVVAAFYAARAKDIDNWFLEPSFFRGRLFFLRNSFSAFRVWQSRAATVSDEVASYLDGTLKRRSIVIPKKDRHQYVPALGKIINRRNIARLFEKLYGKYVLGKHYEFGHIGVYVGSHLSMVLNAVRMRPLYSELKEIGPFIYYPLHVPADMALTLRSPEYLDQLALVDYLLRLTPSTHKVAIKEHPAQIGAVSYKAIRALVRKYDNLVVLPPSENNFAVMERASAVISVNSKSGAEALLLNKPVVVLGDAFYSRSGLVAYVENIRDLGPAVAEALRAQPVASADVGRYFQAVFDNSFPGELYISDEQNIATFVASIRTAVFGKIDPAAVDGEGSSPHNQPAAVVGE